MPAVPTHVYKAFYDVLIFYHQGRNHQYCPRNLREWRFWEWLPHNTTFHSRWNQNWNQDFSFQNSLLSMYDAASASRKAGWKTILLLQKCPFSESIPSLAEYLVTLLALHLENLLVPWPPCLLGQRITVKLLDRLPYFKKSVQLKVELELGIRIGN